MTHYRIYKLDSDTHKIVKAKDIEAADDKEAMAEAANDEDCPVCEVWQSTDKIGSIDRAD